MWRKHAATSETPGFLQKGLKIYEMWRKRFKDLTQPPGRHLGFYKKKIYEMWRFTKRFKDLTQPPGRHLGFYKKV
jgi:hypothetical protein